MMLLGCRLADENARGSLKFFASRSTPHETGTQRTKGAERAAVRQFERVAGATHHRPGRQARDEILVRFTMISGHPRLQEIR
jgi:hypothetical protein